jgi:hypothetical protein
MLAAGADDPVFGRIGTVVAGVETRAGSAAWLVVVVVG